MKISNVVTAALFTLAISAVATSVNAQPPKPAIVDSVNKQLRQGAKPAKVANTTSAVRFKAAASKSTAGSASKSARVVPVPVFTSPSGPVSPSVARSVTDSATKTSPPVRRAAKMAKVKPPAE